MSRYAINDRIRFEMDVDRARFLANLETRPRKRTPTGKEVSKMACGGKKGGKCCGGKKCGGKKGK